MVQEELVYGDGWISDESSFYGDEDEQDRLLSLCDDFDPRPYWKSHSRDLNTVLSMAQPTPINLHNIYEGRADAWQLHESVEDFIKRLPPRTTSIDLCPWIWAANPYPDGQERSSGKVDDFIPRGIELLQRSLQERRNIRGRSRTTGMQTLSQEGDALKQRIVQLAQETKVLAGKWMLFPSSLDLTRVWRLVVDGTINNRLGTAAKVATNQDGKDVRLICVYTKDFRDTDDVLRVLQQLVALGLVNGARGIYYKSDAYTYLDIYGQNATEYGLQASAYSSQKMLASANSARATPAPQKKRSTLDAAFRRPN